MQDISFTQAELKKFVQVILEMITSGEEVEISKAVHHAKYLVELDKRLEEMKAGHYVEFTDNEWEHFTEETERLSNSCPEKPIDLEAVLVNARRLAMIDDYEQKKQRGEFFI